MCAQKEDPVTPEEWGAVFNAPHCTDCRHAGPPDATNYHLDPPAVFRFGKPYGKPYCNRIKSPVSGNFNLTCEQARLTPGLCEPSGRFFERRDT